MRKYREYTDQDIIYFAKKVKSISGLLKLLGLKIAGGNYSNIKRKLQILNIDTSHWTGKSWSKNERLKDWGSYTKSAALKPHLIKERGLRCESCQLETWLGKPIPIELHHIDGNRTNNVINNLQLLCPNCHSFTPNYRVSKYLI